MHLLSPHYTRSEFGPVSAEHLMTEDDMLLARPFLALTFERGHDLLWAAFRADPSRHVGNEGRMLQEFRPGLTCFAPLRCGQALPKGLPAPAFALGLGFQKGARDFKCPSYLVNH